MQRQATPGLLRAYDAGFGAGVKAGSDLIQVAKTKLLWCWWVVLIEAVLLAAFVAHAGVAWLVGE